MKQISDVTKLGATAKNEQVKNLIEKMYNEPKSYNIMKDYKIEIERIPIKMKGYRLDPGSMVMGGGKNIQVEDNKGLDRET